MNRKAIKTVIQKQRWLVWAGLLATVGALGACNTVQGVGEDVQSAGRHLEEAAN